MAAGIVYPARGVGMLWEPPRGQAPEAIGELVGNRRADILLALDQPRSTAELARRLDVPDSSVSQHLRVLRRPGLVNGHRGGRVVLYMPESGGADVGEALLAIAQGDPANARTILATALQRWPALRKSLAAEPELRALLDESTP